MPRPIATVPGCGLRCPHDGKEAGLCEQIGLARSTVHRLLQAMRNEGLVETLYERLRDAALPPAGSLDLLTKAAAELPDR